MNFLETIRDVKKEFELIIKSSEMDFLSDTLLELDRQIEMLEVKRDQVKARMIDYCEEHGIESGIAKNHKIDKLVRKGNVDYSAVPQLKGVNLEKFRKEATLYYRFKAR